VGKKQNKYLKIFVVVVVVIVGLHFIPVYSRTGRISAYTTSTSGIEIQSSVCIGYTAFNNRDYRVVLGGFGGFSNDKKHFHQSNNLYDNPGSCDEPIRQRLYIF
jgi:hypothetical protein